ncbi:thymidylate kinase [Thiogranum longum]|uniref:Thymidylate kinase n=1 Tax=Thiogranum longum TaxID=1537524 RepID=A0A4R1H8E3_9GAMM|nr:hypothetical protein [Thiogranum longum]TCK18107.1 thymidylate kinase [Thiogranum longum]
MSGISEHGLHLFKELDRNNIRYCHWKNNQTVEEGLRGEDDLDILVARDDAQSFFQVLLAFGFHEAENRYMKVPFVYHYYGLDEHTGVILHIHVYLKLYTGESHTKNFHFPFEKQLLESSNQRISGCPVPSWEWQLFIYLVRYYLKISCVIGFILLYSRQSEFKREYKRIIDELDEVAWDALVSNMRAPFSVQTIESLRMAFNEKGPNIRSVLLGISLRWRLFAWRRRGVFRDMSSRYSQILYRVINKYLLHQKKRLVRGGAVIAITGFDGTGKTTTCSELEHWFGKQFDVRLDHFGRPKAKLITLPLRIMIGMYRSWKRKKHFTSPVSKKDGVIAAIRYCSLAFERYSVLRRSAMLRDKGYVVILDRYPSLTTGGMDSPQLKSTVETGYIYRFFERLEGWLYSSMPQADLLLVLEVPVETALLRNQKRIKKFKESDDELLARHVDNQGLEYEANVIKTIDVTSSLDETMKVIKSSVWSAL